MSNELSTNDNNEMNELIITSNNVNVPAEYKDMVNRIQKSMPAMMEDSSNFHKSHSQYMGAMLDVTAITPIRRVKHILAEINRTKGALEEAYIKQRKNEIELTVSDNGIGIPPEISYKKTKSLGLHLVNLLVEDQFQGTLKLIRGKGTNFEIRFKVG